MNPKRIAVISYYSCPLNDEKKEEAGGRQIYTLELSKELAKKGYIIDIFTRTIDKNVPKIVNVAPNLRVIHMLAGPEEDIPKKKLNLYIPEFLENFYKFLIQQDATYNWISCHYYLSGLVGLEIKKKLNIPFFITFHSLALMKNLVARNAEETEDHDRVNAEFLLTKTADKVIATSKKDAEYINTLYNCPSKKIEILMPGTDLNLFKPMDKKVAKNTIKANPNDKLILFVGRTVPLKGIDIILYTLQILKANEPALYSTNSGLQIAYNTRMLDFASNTFAKSSMSGINLNLWVIGSASVSNDLKRLKEIIKLLNLEDSIKFTGIKKQNELPVYYNAADIVVMPSLYESFGMTALEAMSCGVPVITTDTTGVSDLFENEQKLITPAINPASLAEKIKNLLTNEKEYQKIRQTLLAKAQNLTWEHAADTFINILKK